MKAILAGVKAPLVEEAVRNIREAREDGIVVQARRRLPPTLTPKNRLEVMIITKLSRDELRRLLDLQSELELGGEAWEKTLLARYRT